jgi:hypothetical protein
MREGVKNRIVTIPYCAIKIGNGLRQRIVLFIIISKFSPTPSPTKIPTTEHLKNTLLHHIVFHYTFVDMLVRSYRPLLESIQLNIYLLSYITFLFFQMSSKNKMISVSEETWRDLTQKGTLADTFDSVIRRMIDKEKVATSGGTLAGTTQTAATEPLSSEKALVKTPSHE